METTCLRCGALWEPDASPDVESVVVEEATGAVLLVVGPAHQCGRITEWD